MRQRVSLAVKGGGDLGQPGPCHWMSQVDGAADAMMDLEIAGDEGEGRHVVARPPGSGVGFRGIDGVFARGNQGFAKHVGIRLGERVCGCCLGVEWWSIFLDG